MNFAEYWQLLDITTKLIFFTLVALSSLSWITGIIRIYNSLKLKRTVATDLVHKIDSQKAQWVALANTERKTVIEHSLMQHIGRYRIQAEKGLSILGTTVSISPFIGLFGTVWGIYHALINIGESGQAGLSQVSGPVGEALILTGLGIAVAIPAVVFYNISIRINRMMLFKAQDTAYGILKESAHCPNQFSKNPKSNL